MTFPPKLTLSRSGPKMRVRKQTWCGGSEIFGIEITWHKSDGITPKVFVKPPPIRLSRNPSSTERVLHHCLVFVISSTELKFVSQLPGHRGMRSCQRDEP